MTIHYHGTPITPRAVLQTLTGKCFCVSHAAPQDIEWCHLNGQSVMLDNGAFSHWRTGKPKEDWTDYYEWCEQWLRYRTTWAVIPDVIDGTEEDNDKLLIEWPHVVDQASPVWHMHEGLARLERLVKEWPTVCIGSSGDYELKSAAWVHRMNGAWDLISRSKSNAVVHMLRGMQFVKREYQWPFASVDSTDVARNHNRGSSALEMCNRWDSMQCLPTWDGPLQGRLNMKQGAQTNDR